MRRALSYALQLCLLTCFACQPEEQVSFNSDIRPILNQKCISCHGGVKQSGGFGLVFRKNALVEGQSGKRTIVPGSARRSELVRRLRHEDPELRMPFEGPPLPEEEITLIEKWIDQGAVWETHWAYEPVVPVAPPETDALWPINEVDRFVLAQLSQQNLAPAARAQKRTLLRRLSLDLTGLPPTPELMEQFLADDRLEAYAIMVDTLLASPRFGEHWSSMWLDLARYADSRGHEKDAPRTIWQFRDWVINAFNEDMPFDQFTVEQLAGDLLPQPTSDQLVATAFHRNTLSNDEGGTSNEEYRTVAVIDRVNTTWETWLGTTMACVQCHSHPYDPIEHEAFYQSYAYFNNSADHDHYSEAPYLTVFKTAEAEKLLALEDWVEASAGAAARDRWSKLLRLREPRMRPHHFQDIVNGVFTDRGDEDILFLYDGSSFGLPLEVPADCGAIYLEYRPYHEGLQVSIHKESVTGELVTEVDLTWRPGPLSSLRIPIPASATGADLFLVFHSTKEGKLGGVYSALFEEPLPEVKTEEAAALVGFIDELLAAQDSIRTPVMVELPDAFRRATQVFDGGNWLVRSDTVQPGVPGLFPAVDSALPANRLALAKWIVNPDNPLTARVAVNRFWAKLFGRGIVATPEDFGSQGALPTHPELLDWLAYQFSHELDWSVKDLLRKLVLSSTYQQSSAFNQELLAADPYNEWLSRGHRRRLSAEEVRDQLLAVSGLLSNKIGGPSVMPDQPDGLWDAVVYSGLRWQTSPGEDRYRRTLYTFLRRSVPHPLITTFDGTNREVCRSRRVLTNTPLQALMSLNDPVVLAGAKALAIQLKLEYGTSSERIKAACERLFYEPPSSENQLTLELLYAEAMAEYTAEPTAVLELVDTDDPELAATVVVINALLNLDQFLTNT